MSGITADLFEDEDGVGGDPRPPFNVVYTDGALRNTALNTDNMDVNGSSTTRDFEYGPPSGQIYYLSHIVLLMQDPGSMDINDFGSISGNLSNGLQLIAEINSTEHTIFNLIDNGSIATCFSDFAVHSGGGDDNGFLDDEDSFIGLARFKPEITLNGDNGDKMIMRVRDNLNGISRLQAIGRAWRKL